MYYELYGKRSKTIWYIDIIKAFSHINHLHHDTFLVLFFDLRLSYYKSTICKLAKEHFFFKCIFQTIIEIYIKESFVGRYIIQRHLYPRICILRLNQVNFWQYQDALIWKSSLDQISIQRPPYCRWKYKS